MLKSVYKNGGFYVGKYETGIEDEPKTSGSSLTAPTETPVIKQNAYPYRGGFYLNTGRNTPAAYRYNYITSDYSNYIGFRVSIF